MFITENTEYNEFVLPGYPNIHMKGGGGGSGTVDYPAYMKDFHGQGLNSTGVDTITTSMADLMNLAFLTNPYAAISYYSGSTELAAINAAVDSVEAASASRADSDWDAAFDAATAKVDANIFSPDSINTEVAAFTTILDNDLDSSVYPKYEAGMRDINAVMSSAFLIGKALIVEGRNAQIAKYDADLRHRSYVMRAEVIVKEKENLLDWYKRVYDFSKETAAFSVDVSKMSVIINREGVDQDLILTNKESTWEFEAYVYAGNFMAAIGGGTGIPTGMSKAQSALSGAFSGAAAGSAINGETGAGYGAVIGGIGGLLAG